MVRKEGYTDEMIMEMFNRGDKVSAIAELVGIGPRSIRNVVYKSGTTSIKKTRNRKYKVHEDFFKTWSNEMAYVLGLIASDGCVTKNPKGMNTQWQIIQSDKEFLKKILKTIGSTHKITKDNRSTAYRFFIGSVEMVDDLICLGIEPNKSKTIEMPRVPKQYISHFLRGIIDGDGWIHHRGYTMNITSASPKFADSILNIFLSLRLNARIKSQISEGGTRIYRITVSGKQDVLRLSDWLYEDCEELYLPRKREAFNINK